MKAYKLGDQNALNLAINTLDTENFDPKTSSITARYAALKLINTLDHIEYIDVEKIPLSPPSPWFFQRKEILQDAHPVKLEIALHLKANKWLFTPQTIEHISLFESLVEGQGVDDKIVKLKTWRQSIRRYLPWFDHPFFLLSYGQWILIILVSFVSLVGGKTLRFLVARKVFFFLKKRHVPFPVEKQNKLTAPIGVMAFGGLWIFLIKFVDAPDSTLSFMLRAGRIVFTIGIVISIHHLVDVISLFLEKKAKESKNTFDDILIPLVRKTAKFFIVAFGMVAIGDSLTLDMKGILAGMGIGGIAFALAAKDTISNLFGSFTVLMDRPFGIGDWVVIEGKIEGMVEEVGLRSTRVRTFYDSLITVPNGTLTNAHIDNYGKRTYRRYTCNVAIQYDTPPELIEAFCEGIRNIIAGHQWTRKDSFHVYLSGLGESSLNILVYLFWKVPDWPSELLEKHRLLLDILRLGKKLGVEFAFPTQHLYLQNTQGNSYKPIEKSFEFGAEQGRDLAAHTISPQRSRSRVETLTHGP